jgi:hypothetical protein
MGYRHVAAKKSLIIYNLETYKSSVIVGSANENYQYLEVIKKGMTALTTIPVVLLSIVVDPLKFSQGITSYCRVKKKSSIVQPYVECGIKCQVIPRTQLDKEETSGRCQAPRDLPPSPVKLMISSYIFHRMKLLENTKITYKGSP